MVIDWDAPPTKIEPLAEVFQYDEVLDDIKEAWETTVSEGRFPNLRAKELQLFQKVL